MRSFELHRGGDASEIAMQLMNAVIEHEDDPLYYVTMSNVLYGPDQTPGIQLHIHVVSLEEAEQYFMDA